MSTRDISVIKSEARVIRRKRQMNDRRSKIALFLILTLAAVGLIAITTIAGVSQTTAGDMYSNAAPPAVSNKLLAQLTNKTEAETATLSPEQRLELLERTLDSIRITSGKAEERSYYNKLVSGELLSYMRIIAIILLLIAIGFPLTLLLLSRNRLIGLSGLSSEVTATLMLIEERQSKLAHILREIQGEIDYMHSMSAPDLKNLIQQAEAYLKQNEQDLNSAGLKTKTVDESQSAKTKPFK